MPSHIAIQSADRLPGGTSSNFRVEIPVFARSGSVALLSASIPNTLYNIYEANNGLAWERVETPYFATIARGAYGVTDLLGVLAAQMNAVDPGGSYSASYSPVTMKITLSSTDSSFGLTLSIQDKAIWKTLGFTGKIDTGNGFTQTGDSVLRLDFPSHLYLDIGLPGQDVVNTAWHRANYVIPMDNISQYVQIYERNSTFDQLQCYSLGAGINTLNVKLTRPDGSIADLNGSEWSFIIGIECPSW